MLKTFLPLFLFSNGLFATTIHEAEEVYQSGDIQNAIKLYKEVSKSGDEEADFKLGLIYYNGKGINKDLNISLSYFNKAAQYGHKKAKYNIATIYGQRTFLDHNYTKAFKLYKELAVQGYPQAQNKVGVYLTHGLGVDKDYKLAVRWFEEAYFKNNYKPASCNLALMYASGKGVFPNLGRARELAQDGYENKLPECTKVYKDFNLQKYDKDKGFKFGFYK